MAMSSVQAASPLVKAESLSNAATISTSQQQQQHVRVSNFRGRACGSISASSSAGRLHRPLARQFHGSIRTMWKSPVNKQDTVDASSNATAVSAPSLEVSSSSEEKEVKPAVETPSASTMTGESITTFMEEVANIVKLVDSRDIMELHLKQPDCELLIRKMEALPQPPPPPQQVMVQAPYRTVEAPPPPPAAPSPSNSIVPAASSTPKNSSPVQSGHPPLKSPMAGTFYRSPAPGEPPFVKVGDQVQKGQLVCIIEAMKMMNEIEADRSGTVVEFIAQDGKPVSIDSPLIVIAP